MNYARWYTPNLVCDDSFGSIDVELACTTLGFTYGGSFETVDMSDKWSESEIPIWMDNVNCVSNSTNFLLCETNGFGINDCDHSENVLLTCFESG